MICSNYKPPCPSPVGRKKKLRMKNSNRYLAALLLLLLLVFLMGKIAFAWYNSAIETMSVWTFLKMWAHGLALDLHTAALMLLVPALCTLTRKFPVRWILVPYFCLLGLVMGAIIVADMVMYEFWEFKLCAVHLSYAASPEGTTNSVSIGFLLSRALTVLVFILMIAVPAIWMTPKGFPHSRQYRMLIVLSAIAILPVGVRNCYHRGSLFLSHAATNPVFRFITSFGDARHYAASSVWCDGIATDKTEGAALPCYKTSDEVTDTLLNTQRPNVLFVQLESFGSQFVKEMGGLPDVSPNLSRLIPEGIFWEQYYNSSFRTDRGTACAYSGWIPYPTISPMKEASMHNRLSSLARSFFEAGYQTGYMYAGAMTNMGKYQYVAHMGFEAIMDESYFTKEELNSSWGANDGTAATKLYKTIAEIRPDAQWMMVWQTLSSHEPWVVPYQRLEDEKLNAFAYTDQCLGDLIDSLKTLPVWENLLVIVIPDHGFLYNQTYDTSDFFHSPMLWLGGAIKEPRRMKVLMNQSDIAATLLAQMGLKHDEYRWSRNVLAPDYKPFVYCNYPAGLLYKDLTGETMYDLTADKSIPVDEPVDTLRLQKALAILHHSYQE